jgi:sugar (pentulose or hexulose) kinase
VKAIRNGVGKDITSTQDSQEEDVFRPDPAKYQMYQELLSLYQSAIDAMSPWWKARDQFLKSQNKKANQ